MLSGVHPVSSVKASNKRHPVSSLVIRQGEQVVSSGSSGGHPVSSVKVNNKRHPVSSVKASKWCHPGHPGVICCYPSTSIVRIIQRHILGGTEGAEIRQCRRAQKPRVSSETSKKKYGQQIGKRKNCQSEVMRERL